MCALLFPLSAVAAADSAEVVASAAEEAVEAVWVWAAATSGGNFRGGGNRGGGGPRGGWGGMYSAVNDSTPLVRLSGSLTFIEGRGADSPISDETLKTLMDSVMFQRYEKAHTKFIKSDRKSTVGVLLGLPAAIITVVAATQRSDDNPNLSRNLYITAGTLAVPAVAFYTIGAIGKGTAKRSLQQIADDYNVDMELKRASRMLQFEFAPTVMLQTAPTYGATLTLTF